MEEDTIGPGCLRRNADHLVRAEGGEEKTWTTGSSTHTSQTVPDRAKDETPRSLGSLVWIHIGVPSSSGLE